ncbi:hypothetical protein VNO77_39054 [Canavalia gladiata]|uniref:Uncharacterized protein n=1 Tax=Canavalia gladiata TaxID=3824 RepID=A0AAN9KCY3_CANGL
MGGGGFPQEKFERRGFLTTVQQLLEASLGFILGSESRVGTQARPWLMASRFRVSSFVTWAQSSFACSRIPKATRFRTVLLPRCFPVPGPGPALSPLPLKTPSPKLFPSQERVRPAPGAFGHELCLSIFDAVQQPSRCSDRPGAKVARHEARRFSLFQAQLGSRTFVWSGIRMHSNGSHLASTLLCRMLPWEPPFMWCSWFERAPCVHSFLARTWISVHVVGVFRDLDDRTAGEVEMRGWSPLGAVFGVSSCLSNRTSPMQASPLGVASQVAENSDGAVALELELRTVAIDPLRHARDGFPKNIRD